MGWGDPPEAHAKVTGIPWLCARHSLWGELPSQHGGVADQVGDSLIGGEMREMAPSVWEIVCKLCLLDMHHPRAGQRYLHRIAEPSCQKCQGDGDAEGAVPVGDA